MISLTYVRATAAVCTSLLIFNNLSSGGNAAKAEGRKSGSLYDGLMKGQPSGGIALWLSIAPALIVVVHALLVVWTGRKIELRRPGEPPIAIA